MLDRIAGNEQIVTWDPANIGFRRRIYAGTAGSGRTEIIILNHGVSGPHTGVTPAPILVRRGIVVNVDVVGHRIRAVADHCDGVVATMIHHVVPDLDIMSSLGIVYAVSVSIMDVVMVDFSIGAAINKDAGATSFAVYFEVGNLKVGDGRTDMHRGRLRGTETALLMLISERLLPDTTVATALLVGSDPNSVVVPAPAPTTRP